jgi:hypothetical protein
MKAFNIKPAPEWIFSYIENYYHLLFKLKLIEAGFENIKFSINLGVFGFEGLLFYVFKSSRNKIKFDILNHRVDKYHTIEKLGCTPNELKSNFLDFVVIPFGQFKADPRVYISYKFEHVEYEFKLFQWIPSSLFKHFKSIIKVNPEYSELEAKLDDKNNLYFELDSAFKGNDSGYLFNIINLLTNLESKSTSEHMVSDIKNLISKTNEYLFEVSEPSIPFEMRKLLGELERMSNNIENLSKDQISEWIDDILNYYSKKIDKKID